MKRLLAIFLSLTMLVSAAPLSALAASDNSLSQTITVQSQPDADLVQAIASDPFLTVQADSAPVQEQNTTVDTSNVSMEATNSFGKLLLDGMDLDGENGSNFSSGNRVIGITMNGSTATVKYVAEEDADLVVGIYTDDSEEQMVASGTVAVDKTTDGTVKVAIVGEIPDYYIIKGYLLDKAEHAPLCEAFTNTSNTKDMVDLAGATVNDFPEDRVINLDDDNTTNFAVVKQDVTLLTMEDFVAGKNNIVSQDDDGLNYTIANAGAEIKNLQVGDILTYEYAPGELLVVKVFSIAVDGDTVTIYGDDTLDLTDVFDAMKIEGDASNEKLSCDTSEADEGVTYLGESDEDFSFVTDADGFVIDEMNDVSLNEETAFSKKPAKITGKASKKFKLFDENDEEFEGGVDTGEGTKTKATLNGVVSVSASVVVGFYISTGRKYFSFTANAAMAAELHITGMIETRLRLGSFGFIPVTGCYVGFEPTFVAKAEVQLDAKVTTSTTLGVAYDSQGDGFKNLCEAPHTTISADIEGTLYSGIDMCPKIKILGSVVEAKLTAQFGGKGEFTANLWSKEITLENDSIHGCNKCYSIQLKAIIEAGVTLTFLGLDKYAHSVKLISSELPIGEAYWAPEYDDFGLGDCPHKQYKVVASVNKAESEGMMLYISTNGDDYVEAGEISGWGYLRLYLDPGQYRLMAKDGDTIYRSDIFTVKDSALSIKITQEFEEDWDKPGTDKPTKPDKPSNPEPEEPEPEEPTPENPDSGEENPDDSDKPNVVASGICGTNVIWKLDNQGVLTISGNGKMEDYSRTGDGSAPWSENKDLITKVVLEQGVVNVGCSAFYMCKNLTAVMLPAGVVEIRGGAFENCFKLEEIEIPSSVEEIGSGAFEYCTSLKKIAIPEGVTTIESYTFENCGKLEEIQLPSTLISIGVSAFYGSSITSLEIPSGVTDIRMMAFAFCKKLKNIKLPDNLKNISENMFGGCSSLENIEIPEGVTQIGEHAFNQCENLMEVVIPEGVTQIGKNAFSQCYNLRKVELPETVVSIGESAFAYCENLVDIEIPKKVSTIGSYVFSGCASLVSMSIPTGVTKINRSVFSGCSGLTDITLPENITEIGESAFYDCKNLKAVVIPEEVKVIGKGAFNGCRGLTSIIIPESVETLGSEAFKDCCELRTVLMPENVIKIDDKTFMNCGKLINVTVPEGVQTIGKSAFFNCNELMSITLPESLTNIGLYAFGACSNLVDINYNGTKAQWEKVVIDHPDKLWDFSTPTVHCTDGDIVPTAENSITTGKTTTDNAVLHAVFNGLTAGEDYAVIVSRSAENPLDAGNLIYINQKTAGANGVLDVPFVSSESGAAYVVACRKGGSTNPGGNTGKDDSSTSKPGDDTTKPSTPEQPSPSGGGGGGAIVAVVLIGGAAAAVTAGVILMMPVEVSGVAQLGDGNVLANANVQLMKDGQQVAQTTTDESGHFALEVKRGEYELRVTTVNPETGEQTVRTASVKAPAKNTNFVF